MGGTLSVVDLITKYVNLKRRILSTQDSRIQTLKNFRKENELLKAMHGKTALDTLDDTLYDLLSVVQI